MSDNELEHVVGGKDQTKNGGNDDDYMFGCDGDDTIRGNDGDDTIIDFNRTQDVLTFEGISGPGYLNVSTSGYNTIIHYGDTTITLQGVQMTADEVWERVEQ